MIAIVATVVIFLFIYVLVGALSMILYIREFRRSDSHDIHNANTNVNANTNANTNVNVNGDSDSSAGVTGIEAGYGSIGAAESDPLVLPADRSRRRTSTRNRGPGTSDRSTGDPDRLFGTPDRSPGTPDRSLGTPDSDDEEFDHVEDAEADKNVIRCKTNLMVSDLSRKPYFALYKKYRLYYLTLITISIFYVLPVIQLVLTYQSVRKNTIFLILGSFFVKFL